ncbi:MAG: hypothetical protein ABI831_02615 [Betaproteobacteria bacterium]
MKRLIVLLLAVSGLLSACVVEGPKHGHERGFCPPGQAKKGNC